MTDQDHIAAIRAAETALNEAIAAAEATMCISVETGVCAVARGESHYSIEISSRVMPDHLTIENTARVGRQVKIYFDGAEVKDVTEAHMAEGWVEVIAKDDTGNVLLDGDNIRRKRLTGTVTAEWV